jgi:putative spermidine/putrescine transport system permease protein
MRLSLRRNPATGASPWNLLPAAIVILVFFSAFAIFFYTSFQQQVPGQTISSGPLSLANYQRFIESAAAWKTLGDTLKLSAELTLASIVLGYPVAYVMVRCTEPRLRSFIMASLVVTFLSGTVTRAYAWLIILGNSGLINSLLRKAGLVDSPLALLYNKIGVFIALLHFVLPFFVLTLLGPLKNVPRTLEESAINLGASRLKTFVYITLPLSVPGLIAASSLTFAVSLSSFLFPLVLGGGRVRLVSNEIYELIFVSFDLPFAAATATVFLIVSLAFLWAFSMAHRIAGSHANKRGS